MGALGLAHHKIPSSPIHLGQQCYRMTAYGYGRAWEARGIETTRMELSSKQHQSVDAQCSFFLNFFLQFYKPE